MKETIIFQILYVITLNAKFKSNIYSTYLSIILLEQEPLSIVSSEVLTDNGVTKEFDPLRNSKEERSKTPQATQQLKCKCNFCVIFHSLILRY